MAKLKETYVSGNLWITGSSTFVSASEFRGPLNGTASIANNLNPSNSYTVQGLTVGGVGGASGSAHIHGDLKVDGDLIYVGVQDLRVKDKTIELNANESGSAVQDADGAGIIIRNSSAEGDISILYDKASDSLVINKPISGSMTRAATASVAEKVKFALSFGSGISKSAASYNGSAGVTISLDTASVKSIKVNSASNADSASKAVSASYATSASKAVSSSYAFTSSEADHVSHPLTIQVDGLNLDADYEYDGREDVGIQLDFRPLESSSSAASASIADIYSTLAEITGSGTGSVEQQIQAAISQLSSEITLDATENQGTAPSGGVWVAQQINLNESEGLLDGSSNIGAVAVDPAGAAISASTALSSSISASLKDWKAISGSVKRLETSASVIKSTYTTTASFNAYTSSANGRLSKLESASASLNTFTSSANGRLTALESASASIQNNYVKKAGDTMSGALWMDSNIHMNGDTGGNIVMGSHSILMGSMKIQWNSTDGCIEFSSLS